MESQKLHIVLQDAAESLFPADDGLAIDVNTRSADGDTPLHLFSWRADVESAKVLIDAGADVNAVGDMSETPLHVALRQQSEALVELFLKAGANVTIRSEFNKTPQEMAKELGGKFAEMLSSRKSRREVSRDRT